MEVYINGGTPKMDGFSNGKSQPRMEDDWGYPHDYGNPHIQCMEHLATELVPKPDEAIPPGRGLWSPAGPSLCKILAERPCLLGKMDVDDK